jgi:O-antigen/teichoic acid export membrane protein
VSPRPRGLRRVGAGIADQLLYSASNFALTIVVARSTTVDQFGLFSLLLTTNLILVAVARGLTSETLIVRYSAADVPSWRRAANSADGLSLLLGLASGVVVAVVALAVGGDFRNAGLALAVVLPGLLVQDFLRYAAIAAKRPSVALANDATQVVTQFAAIGVLLAVDRTTTPLLVLAWGGSAYLGAVVGTVMLKVLPRVSQVRDWWRREHDMASRYALDDLGSAVGPNAAVYVVAAVTGLEGPAAIRGAQTVFGPPSILNLSIQVAVVPELVRTLQKSVRAMDRRALFVGVAMAVMGGVWGGLALLAPDSLGRFLFGDTWDVARGLLVYYLINQVAAGLRQTPVLGLRALGAANRSLISRVIQLGVALIAQVTGAVIAGAEGVAIGLAIGGPVIVVGCWWQYRLALAEYRADASGETGGGRHRRDAAAVVSESVEE